MQRKQAVIPIEVKVYVNQFQPEHIRLSMADYREQDWLVNMPLYDVSILGNDFSDDLLLVTNHRFKKNG